MPIRRLRRIAPAGRSGGRSASSESVKKIAAIEPAVDVQRLSQPPGAAAKETQILEPAPLAHQRDALERLERANEHRRADAHAFRSKH